MNPYHLPGWFLTAMAVLSMIIVLLFFSEPRPWALRVKCNKCSCRTGNGLSFKLKSKAKTRVMVSFHCLCLSPLRISYMVVTIEQINFRTSLLSRILAQSCVTPPYIIQAKGYA